MHWQINTTLLFSSLSREQQSWLTDTQSLTKRLYKLTNNQIKFCVLHNALGDAPAVSRELLELEAHEKTWVRQIEFRYHDVLWVSATVVIPEGPLTKKEVGLTSAQPIGETLFKNPALTTREPFMFCQFSDGQFARRSRLYYKENLLLITEIFSRDFLQNTLLITDTDS